IKVEPQSGFGGEPVGNVEVEYVGGLRGVNVGAGEVPNLIDEIPILALLATSAIGTTIFENVSELRVKESNRLEAIVEGLNALGCHATEKGDDLLIEGGVPVNDVVLPSRGDHRLAMTWAIANRCFGLDGGVDGMECTDVSFPGFEEELERLQQGGDR
ncbi:MAG: 3-phosphoshikimate 1-carboxyvinyltransferase, partial [Coriobacteriales bacterium]